MEYTYQELCHMAGLTVAEAENLGLNRAEIANLIKIAA
jgi:hypothetical protein